MIENRYMHYPNVTVKISRYSMYNRGVFALFSIQLTIEMLIK